MLKFVKLGIALVLVVVIVIGLYLFFTKKEEQVSFDRKINVIDLDGRTTKKTDWGIQKEADLNDQTSFIVNGLINSTYENKDGFFVKIQIPNKELNIFLGKEKDSVPLNKGLISIETDSTISLHYYKEKTQWTILPIDKAIDTLNKSKGHLISVNFNLNKSLSDEQSYYTKSLSQCNNDSVCTGRVAFFQNQLQSSFETVTGVAKDNSVIVIPITRILLE